VRYHVWARRIRIPWFPSALGSRMSPWFIIHGGTLEECERFSRLLDVLVTRVTLPCDESPELVRRSR